MEPKGDEAGEAGLGGFLQGWNIVRGKVQLYTCVSWDIALGAERTPSSGTKTKPQMIFSCAHSNDFPEGVVDFDYVGAS